MNRRGSCSVCDHPNLRAITTDLMARASYRTIESRYSVSRAAIDRHVRKHVTKGLKLLMAAERESLAVQTLADADAVTRPVLSEMRNLNARALRILNDAEAAQDRPTALHAIRECRRNLELIAKLTGELDPRAAGETPGAPLSITVQYVQKQNTIQMFPQVAASQEMPRAGDSSPAIQSLPRAEGDGGPECC
jgi:hypothetical protein